MIVVYVAIACGLLAVLYGLVTARQVLALSPGNPRMVEIAGAIQEGARTYLARQYRTIAIVGVVMAAIVFFVPIDLAALHFDWGIGGVWAGLAAFIGVRTVGMVIRCMGQRWLVVGATRDG